MCGRARCTLRGEDTAGACHRRDGRVRTVHMDRYRPSYNVSPGNALPVVYREDGSDADGVVLHCMKWGLIPSFTKKTEKPDHYKMFNARSESIYEKASFRRLIPKNRCLVAVEGFYEWKKDGPRKQPYYIHFEDGRPLVFAALYDSWKNSEGEIIYTFSILTTSSSSALKWLHDRMPVILGNKESTDTWLNGSSVAKFDNVLKPYEDPDLVWYPVTPAMGKSSFDGPECIKKIELKAERSNPISKFFSTKRVKREEESELEVKRVKREEEESDLEVKGSCPESTKTDASKSLEKEPNQRENTAISSGTEGGLESKSTTITSKEGSAKCQMKLEDRELKGDSEPVTDATAKLCSTPARKKGNLKRGNDNNQPTLFSYFGKN